MKLLKKYAGPLLFVRGWCGYACYFSLMRVKVDQDKCVSYRACKRACPMEVDVTDNSRKRLNSTECILCMKCVDQCPTKALRI